MTKSTGSDPSEYALSPKTIEILSRGSDSSEVGVDDWGAASSFDMPDWVEAALAPADAFLSQQHLVVDISNSDGTVVASVSVTVLQGDFNEALHGDQLNMVAKAAWAAGIESFRVSSFTDWNGVARDGGPHADGRAMDIDMLNGQTVRSLAGSQGGMSLILGFMSLIALGAPAGSQILGPGGHGYVATGDGGWVPQRNYFVPQSQYDGLSLAQVHSGHIHYGWPR
jgi:hypothetical protein